MVKVPYLNLPKQFNDQTLWQKILGQFESCHFVFGEALEQFEIEFAKLCETRFALGLNSGTDAIFLALRALNIGEGDEVITVPNSFIATAGAIVAAGAKPVFVDVGPDYNMDISLVESAITPNTKAILPVHLTGNMADMPALMEIANRRQLAVIEDAAQSVAAAINGKRSGSFGDAGCFSLHPLKNLNVCGDGGVLVTNSEEMYNSVKQLRNHGLKNRNEIDSFGYNSRLDSIQALVGLHGMAQLEEVTQKRIANAAFYDRALQNMQDDIILPPRDSNRFQVFHTYVIQAKNRESLIEYLDEQGVETKIHYPIPIHLQKPCQEMGYSQGDFPVCEKQSAQILTLPIHQYLEESELEYVVDRIKTFYGRNSC